MTEPYLTLAEIEAKYPNEWVLLANPKKDRHNRVIGGSVILHASTRAEYSRLLDQWDDPDVNHIASLYTGPLVNDYGHTLEEPEPPHMNAPYLTRAEIEAQYPNEWVWIANPKLDRANEVLGGHVVLHAAERFEFYRLIRSWDDPTVKLTASLYTGPEVIESELAIEEQGAA